MKCERIGNAIVCSRRQRAKPCSTCGGRSNKLCDFILPKKTCDQPICARCSRSVPNGKDTFDLCKLHKDFYICPFCRHGHDRGPVNGENVYRCLNCGQSSIWNKRA